MDLKVMVDVLMPVYNHERFLKQAIESITSQKTDFKFRLVIGEDLSTDNSRKIIEDFKKMYPDVIYPLYSSVNVGGNKNMSNMLMFSTAKYIALCEGDDYWIDEYKLQKQVDFLEKNKDYSICFSTVNVLYEIGTRPSALFDSLLTFTKDTYSIEDFILPPEGQQLYFPTMTLIFRNTLPDPLPDFYFKTSSGDMALCLLLLLNGNAKLLNEKTAVYRQHSEGVTKSEEFRNKMYQTIFDLFDNFNDYSNYKYNNVIKKRLYPISKTLLIYISGTLSGRQRRRHIFETFKLYKKYSPKNIKEVIYLHSILFFPSILKLYNFLFKS